ncbi:hypothetical protein [Umezawaea tangerina]|nr:hypothetical protein [Umezawaea tangerina]
MASVVVPAGSRPVFPAPPPAGAVVRPLTEREVGMRAARVLGWARGSFLAISSTTSAVVHVLLLVLWTVLWPVFGSTPGVFAGLALTVVVWSVGRWFTVGCTSLVFARVVVGHDVRFADLRAELKPVAWRLLGLSALCGWLLPVSLVGGVAPPGVLAVPALVLERLGIRQAVVRSRDLLHGEGGRTFRVLAPVRLSTLAISSAVPLTWLRVGPFPLDATPFGWLLLAAVFATPTLAVAWTNSGAVLSMYYVDRYLAVATRPAPPPSFVHRFADTG